MTTATAPRITATQVAGVTLGNALEFYDFLVFTFFAVEIGHAFFPAANPQSSLLAALATFGAGFLTRPLGGIVLGVLGDRIGRRPAMLVSFALIGIASLGVALTPSYAAIGVAAPAQVIFWRLLQGFALGGEVGPSTAFLAEAAPPHRRGFYVSMQMFGQNVAVLVAGLVGLALAQILDDATLATWGWRIALALGVGVLPIGLALRRTLPETMPEEVAATAPPPLSAYRRTAIIAFLALLSGTIMTYVTNFLTTYAKTTLNLSSGVAFWATVGVGVGGTVGAPLGGWLADRYGRRPAMILPTLLVCVITLPAFWLVTIAPGETSLFAVGCGLRLAIGIALSAVLVHITEDFPPRIRSGALSIVYALAISIFGGTTQFVVAWLTGVSRSPMAPAWYMAGAAAIGFLALCFARETTPVRATMKIRRLLLWVAPLIVAFGLGMVVENWRATREAIAYPCSIEQWDPNIERFVSTSADIRDCVKLDRSRSYSGVWSDFAYTNNHFSPDDQRGLPRDDLGLEVDPYNRSTIYSLAGISGPINDVPGHRYRLTFTGRLARIGRGWLDTPSNLIVVDKVSRAELLPDETPTKQ